VSVRGQRCREAVAAAHAATRHNVGTTWLWSSWQETFSGSPSHSRVPTASNRVTPKGTQIQVGRFQQITLYNLTMVYKIDALFLLKSNRKSHALYRMIMLPVTLGYL